MTPNQSLVAGRAKITADTTGVEHVVLIATRGEGRPIDFSMLESHTLQLALESSRGPGDATFDTALGKLFQSAFYGEGQQRGLTIKEIDQYPLRTISWRVRPGAAAFWGTLENEQLAAAARFQAARELANLPDDDPANAERWQKSAPFVADYLVATLTKNYSQYKAVVAALRPLHKHLIDALAAIFRDPAQRVASRAGGDDPRRLRRRFFGQAGRAGRRRRRQIVRTPVPHLQCDPGYGRRADEQRI